MVLGSRRSIPKCIYSHRLNKEQLHYGLALKAYRLSAGSKNTDAKFSSCAFELVSELMRLVECAQRYMASKMRCPFTFPDFTRYGPGNPAITLL